MDQENRIRNTLNIIIISGIFAVVLSLLMLFNYLQLAGNDPIENETIGALTERLSGEPGNEALIEEIRAFDLLARKAYFNAKWQLQTGGWLLLISAVVLIVSLRQYFSFSSKFNQPVNSSLSQQLVRQKSSRWILAAGLLLIVLAVAASFFSVNHLEHYEVAIEESSVPVSVIEVVDLTGDSSPVSTQSADRSTEDEPAATTSEQPKAERQEAETSESPAQPAVETSSIQTSESKPGVSFPGLETLQKQYPGFRGALGHGIAHTKGFPSSWNIESGENIRWKIKIPLKGYSSPVIWENQLFLTGANEKERWVYCYNTENGEIIWQKQADNIPQSPATAPKTTDDTGLAAPSVVTDGNFVVAIFGTGDLIAFNMKGERQWARNLGVPDNHYGHSSSLLAWKEKVVIQYDTNKGGRLLSVNIQSGETIWDIKRSSHISWASPILIEVDDKMQIVTSAEPTVAGYDLESGKELWKADIMMGEVGPSPGYGNGLVFATNEYATLAAIDPSKGEVIWEDNYYLPEVASPVVADGLVFIGTTYGVFACFDAHTANMYWEAEFGEGFYSSPIAADGKIYTTDMSGTVHIIKVDRELEKIADIAMGEKITTTPAFANGRIYIRGNEHLYCIGK